MAEADVPKVSEDAEPKQFPEGIWPKYLDKAKQILKGSSGYQAMLVVLLAAGLALLIVSWLWSQSTDYQPLYGNQELYDVASIVSILEKEGIDYRLHPVSGQVMVDAGQRSLARMKLSVAGIQAQKPTGLESLEKQEMGASQFIENIRYRKGLEGELAQTVISLKPVRNARIHLAIPKRSSFIRRQEKPTASVFVDIISGYKLSHEQVEGIINLVATSITNMKREDVSVVDQYGNLLSADVLLNNSALGEATKQLDFKNQVESRYRQRISNLLEPLVGPNNFRAQVTASVDFEKVVQTVEQFDPNASVLRSEQGKEKKSNGGFARGIPGTLSNQPPAENDDENNAENGQESTTEQSEYIRNYEVDKVVRQVSNQQGRVTKLSIAIVLNENSDAAVVPNWDQERLDSMRQMMIDAAGIDLERGDQISIHLAPFVQLENAALAELPWWQQSQTLYYAKYASGTLLAILILLFVIRPMIQQVSLKFDPDELPDMSKTKESNIESSTDKKELPTTDMEAPELEDFDGLIAYMHTLSEKEPERVAQVIKLWMNGNG
ncbi:MAG: flagellar basal-body MS-ring/collar protein FliF [Endozoicomonas sp. (ex Botrylloides leachii)]|nr:flagellar basal-body MS-ring/collar protein FliF [Endozoicomonas sp. (ex Botrylloides leachii)]